jgi:UrcA family protein
MLTIKNRSLASFGAVLATFATVVAASPAKAEPATARVRLADIDLASQAGAETLERRINLATARVCRSQDPMMHRAVSQCRREAATRATASLPASHAEVLLAAR